VIRVEVRANDDRIVAMTIEQGVALVPGLEDGDARFQQVLDAQGEALAVFRSDRLVSASVPHARAA
jgi:hypothetical protein